MAVCIHWGVENKVQWIMDVCFREDQSGARTGYAAENLAILGRLTLSLLKRQKSKRRGIKGKQHNAGTDNSCLLRRPGAGSFAMKPEVDSLMFLAENQRQPKNLNETRNKHESLPRRTELSHES